MSGVSIGIFSSRLLAVHSFFKASYGVMSVVRLYVLFKDCVAVAKWRYRLLGCLSHKIRSFVVSICVFLSLISSVWGCVTLAGWHVMSFWSNSFFQHREVYCGPELVQIEDTPSSLISRIEQM
jgi:hypothetical protein